jgi:outer membrane protein assembly factor BamB
VSGSNGGVLWTQSDEAVLAGFDAARSLRLILGRALLVIHPTSAVHALDTKTGRLLWSRSLGEPLLKLCPSADIVQFEMQSGAVVSLYVSTGASAPVRDSCDRATTSQSAGPNFDLVETDGRSDTPSALRARIDVRHMIVPFVGSARVLLGTERSTGNPAVGVVSGGRSLWLAALAADSSGASLFEPVRAAVRYDRVVVPYVLKSEPSIRIECFELATGRRVWTATFEGEADGAGGEIAISHDHRVFVRSAAGHVAVYDLTYGSGWRL